MPDLKVATEPIAPQQVTIIGTGDGGGAPLTTGTTAVTPDHQPNLVVTIVTPVRAIAIRFINTYLTMMSGLIAAGITTNQVPAADFWHLVIWSAKLSIAGAGLGLIKDCVTVFGKLEQRYPLATGNV